MVGLLGGVLIPQHCSGEAWLLSWGPVTPLPEFWCYRASCPELNTAGGLQTPRTWSWGLKHSEKWEALPQSAPSLVAWLKVTALQRRVSLVQVPWDQARGLCSARVRGWHQLQLGSQLGLEEGLRQERTQDWEGSCGWIST